MKNIKSLIAFIKNWVISNGIEGAIGLILGLFLWILGIKIWAGVCFGIFVHKNWELFKNWAKKYI